MHRPLRGYRVPLLAAAILFGGVAVTPAAADAPLPAGADRGADEAVGALVAFLQKQDDSDGDHPRGEEHDGERPHRGREGRGDRPRADGHRPGPGGRRPFDDYGPPNAARPQPSISMPQRSERYWWGEVGVVEPQPQRTQRGKAGPQFQVAPGAPPVLHLPPGMGPPGMGAPGMATQVRAFAIQIGPDGVTKGIEVAPPGGLGGAGGEHGPITIQIDGDLLNLGGGPDPHPGPHPDPYAHVAQQLQLILGKLNAIEARLGGPVPHGQPPMGGPGALPQYPQMTPHAGPHQPGPHQPGPQSGGPMPGGPIPFPQPGQPFGPNMFGGLGVPSGLQMFGGPGLHQPPQPGPGPGPGPGGPNPDELNRRFEEHARDFHRHVEEMARGLGEKLKGAAGGGDELRQMHQKLVKTHEQLQDRFQDIRRRFAEQQERIERLEQEVRRLHESHGAGRAEGEKRDRKHEEKGAKQSDDEKGKKGKKGKKGDRKRDEKGAKQTYEEKQGTAPGANATPNVSYEGEEGAAL